MTMDELHELFGWKRFSPTDNDRSLSVVNDELEVWYRERQDEKIELG